MSPKAEKNNTKCNFAAFDMFGSPVSFNIRGDQTYKTIIGLFWTIVMIISVTGAFVWYFLIFLNRNSVEVTSTIIS